MTIDSNISSNNGAFELNATASAPVFKFQKTEVGSRIVCGRLSSDLENVPENASDLSDEMPYHRGRDLELSFAGIIELRQTIEKIQEDVAGLDRALTAMEDGELELVSEDTFGG